MANRAQILHELTMFDEYLVDDEGKGHENVIVMSEAYRNEYYPKCQVVGALRDKIIINASQKEIARQSRAQ